MISRVENHEEQSQGSSAWADRILMGAVIVTMLLSLVGYMRG